MFKILTNFLKYCGLMKRDDTCNITYDGKDIMIANMNIELRFDKNNEEYKEFHKMIDSIIKKERTYGMKLAYTWILIGMLLKDNIYDLADAKKESTTEIALVRTFLEGCKSLNTIIETAEQEPEQGSKSESKISEQESEQDQEEESESESKPEITED